MKKGYGFFRPIIEEVVERYLDCGNPRCGFALLKLQRFMRTAKRCPDCRAEHLLMFSCHAKRLQEWGEWMKETLLLDVPHRQVVFTIPRMLRIFFKSNPRLLGELYRSALRSSRRYFKAVTRSEFMPGVITVIQTFGDRINLHPNLHFLVTEGGVGEAGVFHKAPDRRLPLAELFTREVLGFLVNEQLLSLERADRLLS